MIYIIISNVGLAIMMILVYGRYSRFRIISSGEIKNLKSKLTKEIEERKSVEEKLTQLTKVDGDKIAELIRVSDDLRREKEGEIKIRVEAEKQIEITLQKTEEVQKRIQDWRLIQDATMKDSKDAIVKISGSGFLDVSTCVLIVAKCEWSPLVKTLSIASALSPGIKKYVSGKRYPSKGVAS